MFDLFRKKVACVGRVCFRGTMPPRPEDFAFLENHKFTVEKRKPESDMHWLLKLTHPVWGSGVLFAPRDQGPIPEGILAFDRRLLRSESADAKHASCCVEFRMPATRENLLCDRKLMFRFLRAILGDDGLLVVDMLDFALWSRAALDAELAHDADLDIEDIYTMHAVMGETSEDEKRCRWLHSHGLREIGAFDFDIMDPSEDIASIRGADFLRAVAAAILEKRVNVNTDRFALAAPNVFVRFVEAVTFEEKADPEYAKIREMDDDSHRTNRAVLCEPVGGLSKWLGGKIAPSKFLSSPLPEQGMVLFSDALTELTAERARNTLSVFRAAMTEFAEFEFPCIVKIGYPIDGSRTEREHMWFKVHACDGDDIDATLLNQPFNIARMKEGQRAMHSADKLTDWMIVTPFGSASPRFQLPLRQCRADRSRLKQMMNS